MMNGYKFFVGPMSKNVVDATIEFCISNRKNIGLIPSRRQIDYDGGYSNNWNTKTFSKYVSTNSNGRIVIQRDHGGPMQGKHDDDGLDSLREDCKHFNSIHIDPWRQYKNYADGLVKTMSLIKSCEHHNPHMSYEVGTEESIRKFTEIELDVFLSDLKSFLSIDTFNKIKYVVIQSGTSLAGNTQTGHYKKSRLTNMVEVCKKYKKLSKEHNGDYVSEAVINDKFSLGLDSINIAPEFGLIETDTYLSLIKDEAIIDKFWKLCYDSKKWVKWVNKTFNPHKDKIELIRICGHYILSNDDFIKQIKSKMSLNIDDIVKTNIKNKLKRLHE